MFLKCIWRALYVREHLSYEREGMMNLVEKAKKITHKCKPQLDILQVVP
jgi:hypothetical protein